MKVQKTPCLGGVEVATVGAMDRRPPGPSAAGRWLAILVVAAALVFGVTSCSNDDDDDPKGPTATVGTSPPTSKPTTSTTTIEDVEAEVEAAYLESFAAYYEAVRAPGREHDLHRTLSGESLQLANDFLDRLIRDKQIAEFSSIGPPRASVVDVEVEGDTALVDACEVDDSRILQLPDRTPVDEDQVSSLVKVRLQRSTDGWRVDHIEVTQRWEDRDGCRR